MDSIYQKYDFNGLFDVVDLIVIECEINLYTHKQIVY